MARTRAEIGALGLPIFAGYLSLDTNKNLRGAGGAAIYRQMLYDEPAATAFVFAAYQLLRTDLSVTSAGNTEADKQAHEFLESCLDDMRLSMGTILRQGYSHLWAGWSIQEVVYKRRNGGNGSRYDDGRVGWATWALRRQESLYRWTTDINGNPTAFQQRPAPTYTLREIPLNRCIHLVSDDSEGSPEGRSALRGMYRQWYFIKNFELLMGIALERGAGLPVFKLDKELAVGLSAEDKATLEEIGGSLRQNEQAYVLLPPGIDFSFAPLPGVNAETYMNIIQRMRAWMLATSLADFIGLGLGDRGGAFALGKDKSELFLMALNGYQNRVLETLNRHVVPKLFRYNDFGTLTDLPQLTLPSVKRYDLQALGTFAKTLDDIGALHITPEDEAWFRRIGDMVDIDVEQLTAMHDEDKQRADALTQQLTGQGGIAETDDGDEPTPAKGRRGQVENADDPLTEEEEVVGNDDE